MRKLFCVYLFLLVFQFLSAHDGYLRNSKVDVLHYEFSVALNDTTDRIEGRALIQIKIIQQTDSISFDLMSVNSDGKGMEVSGVLLHSHEINWKQVADRLTLFFGKPLKQNDTAEVVIKYGGVPSDGLIISKNKFGNRTFFSDNWPNRAHCYLPCIDHPYDKASVDFIITAPDKYKIVASGILIEESDLPGPTTLTHWSETVPLATKVMAFGASGFATQLAGTVNNVPVWTWVYPENRKEGFFDYYIAVKPLAYYSKLIGPYPYKKLANVQSKTIYGGLENAATIFYSERSVTGQGKAEGLIAHEIAHQWFGNCVTEADWHHVWLSEGFATYLTSLYFEAQQGREKLNSDMKSARNRVLRYNENYPTPVVDTTITRLMDLLNANSYQKGAWVLHMLRREIGDDFFFKGLRLYYVRFYNSNALSGDFEKVMEDVSGKDLHKFFQQWLFTPGQPELKIEQVQSKRNGMIEVSIEQKQNTLFEFNLELLIKDISGERIVNVAVKEKITKIEVTAASEVQIIPDPNVNLLFK